MELQEVKDKIKVESAIPEDNIKLKGWIMEADDCFGRGYDDENKYCKECNVMADVDGRKEELFIFCKELVLGPKSSEEELEKEAEASVKPEPTLEKKAAVKAVKELKTAIKEKKEGGANNMESVKGTTAIIRSMLKEGKSQEEIVAALTPMFVEKGATEALAKKRIRPLIYREVKKADKPKVEAPPATETM
jgi:hypothetical protein